MSLGWTLEEALTLGRGTERPFRCHEHDDTTASASVNVLKGVWYCYTCHAKGTVDDTKAPSVADLLAMVEPEKGVRVYSESYLSIFDPIPGQEQYWAGRFPAWLRWQARLGQDPFTGAATFPVYTPSGALAGVGRRDKDPEARPRYKYPPRWSASRVLSPLPTHRRQVVVLTEGYADAVALREVGITAHACYGAGIHQPQVEQLMRLNPDLVLLGFDMDDAGRRAAEMTRLTLDDRVDTALVSWPEKDPGDCTPEEREEAMIQTLVDVRGPYYAADATQVWAERAMNEQDEWERETA